VTSARKIQANRSNARASTGPKTVRGRARAARNALRHGLSLPVYSDSVLSEEVDAGLPNRRSICAACVARAINS
jgi:hypothetical protein